MLVLAQLVVRVCLGYLYLLSLQDRTLTEAKEMVNGDLTRYPEVGCP